MVTQVLLFDLQIRVPATFNGRHYESNSQGKAKEGGEEKSQNFFRKNSTTA